MYYSKITFVGISISKKIPKNSNLYRYYFVEYHKVEFQHA